MERFLGLVVSTGNDVPIRYQKSVLAIFAEESRRIAEPRLGKLGDDLQLGHAKRVQVGVGHIPIGRIYWIYRLRPLADPYIWRFYADLCPIGHFVATFFTYEPLALTKIGPEYAG